MSRYPTLMGVVALFYWALLGSFVCSLVTIPPYEILTFVYFISFVLSVYYLKLDWKALLSREFCIMLVMLSSCLYLNDFFLTEMYKLIEPGIASMVFYCSWPTLSILGIVLFNNAKCSYTNIMGIMMTFSALFYLIYNEYIQNTIHLSLYYLFPVFSAFFWWLHNVLTNGLKILIIWNQGAKATRK